MSPRHNLLRRADIRTQIGEPNMHGLLTVNNTKRHTPFLVFDVSDTGLCLWSPLDLEANSKIQLVLAKPFLLKVFGQVIWCDRDFRGYRIGIAVTNQNERLKSLHRQLNLTTEHRRLSTGSLPTSTAS